MTKRCTSYPLHWDSQCGGNTNSREVSEFHCDTVDGKRCKNFAAEKRGRFWCHKHSRYTVESQLYVSQLEVPLVYTSNSCSLLQKSLHGVIQKIIFSRTSLSVLRPNVWVRLGRTTEIPLTLFKYLQSISFEKKILHFVGGVRLEDENISRGCFLIFSEERCTLFLEDPKLSRFLIATKLKHVSFSVVDDQMINSQSIRFHTLVSDSRGSIFHYFTISTIANRASLVSSRLI